MIETYSPPPALSLLKTESNVDSGDKKPLIEKKYYDSTQLGLPEDWKLRNIGKSEFGRQFFKVEQDRLVAPTKRIEVTEPFRTWVDVVDFQAPEGEKFDEDAVTLIITGGGTSGAFGQNIGLATVLYEANRYRASTRKDGKQPQIKRVIVVPNITGVVREHAKNPQDSLTTKSTSLKPAGEVVASILEKLDVSGKVVGFGFSAGGLQMVEAAAAVNKRKETSSKVTSFDLALIDAAGLYGVDYLGGGSQEKGKKKVAWNFTIGTWLQAAEKYRKLGGLSRRQSLLRALDELMSGWVVPEGSSKGRFQGIKNMIKDALNPMGAYQDLIEEHEVDKKKLVGLGLPEALYHNSVDKDTENNINGKMLFISFPDAGVVANPSLQTVKQGRFKNAEVTAFEVPDASHPSPMVDALNSPLREVRKLSANNIGGVDGQRLSIRDQTPLMPGEEEVQYSPIAEMVVDWLGKQ